MSLLRPLVLITMNNNIQLKCCHIQGSRNDIGDSISRFQWARFRSIPDTNSITVLEPFRLEVDKTDKGLSST